VFSPKGPPTSARFQLDNSHSAPNASKLVSKFGNLLKNKALVFDLVSQTKLKPFQTTFLPHNKSILISMTYKLRFSFLANGAEGE
jgi:hypothetical protein